MPIPTLPNREQPRPELSYTTPRNATPRCSFLLRRIQSMGWTKLPGGLQRLDDRGYWPTAGRWWPF
jgi:hypothetical protein